MGDSNRPLFHRLANREVINFRSSKGKRLNDGNNELVFVGELALNNPLGTFWPDYAQTGALEISVGEDAEVGGSDRVVITADGAGISFDVGTYTWTNIGSDAIDEADGSVNVLMFLKVSDTEINYTVKVNP